MKISKKIRLIPFFNFKKYWHVYVIILLVFGIGSVLAWINRNQINPDGISYIQAARHYASFDIKTAINGYWSPLLSWILIPIIWLNIDPLFGFRLIYLGISLAIIIILLFALNKKNLKTSNAEKTAQVLYLTSFGILLNEWGYLLITPDLLSGAVLMTVIFAIYKYISKMNLKYSIFLGVCLALLYFSKSIGFYVSIALIAFIFIYEIYKFKKISKYILISLLVFTIISGVWIGCISFKYNKLTISTAGSFNFSYSGPTAPTVPHNTAGYLPTKNTNDVWAWDDPSYYPISSWSPVDNVQYYINRVLSTTNLALIYFSRISPLIIFGLFAIFIKKRNEYLNISGYFLVLSTLLLLGAYSLMHIIPRYLWIVAIPLISFGTILLTNKSKAIIPINAILVVVFASSIFSLVPILQNSQQTQLSQGDIKYLSQQSMQIIPAYSTIVGPDGIRPYYCFFSKTRCVGLYKLNGNINHDSSLINEMRINGIQYYIEFAQSNIKYLNKVYAGSSSIHECFDYTEGKNVTCKQTNLTIYKL